PAPLARPVIAASSRCTVAEPAKLAAIGPSLTRSRPLTERASCSVSSAPGRHAATLGKSDNACQTAEGGAAITKLSSMRVQPSRARSGALGAAGSTRAGVDGTGMDRATALGGTTAGLVAGRDCRDATLATALTIPT